MTTPKKAENQPKPTLLDRLATLTRALTARNSLSQQQCRTLGEVAEALARAEAAERERTAALERVGELREALADLVYLNDHPPATDHERALSAAMCWRQARAALAQAEQEGAAGRGV